VVIHLDTGPLSAQARSSFVVKRPLASLADKLEMPPGVRRAKAMNKAMILRNAVDMHEHFLGKRCTGQMKAGRWAPPGPSTRWVPPMRAFKLAGLQNEKGHMFKSWQYRVKAAE
jgi:hypothetical protein